MGSMSASVTRDASIDDVRAVTYKVIPTCMLILLVVYITCTFIYTLNLQRQLPSSAAITITALFGFCLVIFVGGALILRFSDRAARRRSFDVEKGEVPALQAGVKVSAPSGQVEMQRENQADVQRWRPLAQNENHTIPARYRGQDYGSNNEIHRQSLANAPNDRDYRHRGPRDSIEINLPGHVDLQPNVPRRVEPQPAGPSQLDARHPNPLSSNPGPDYRAPGAQTRPPMQSHKPSIPESIPQNPRPNHGPGHDARSTLPSIRITSPSPPFNHWPGGSDHTFDQGSGTPVTRPQNGAVHHQNRPSHAQGGLSGPPNGALSPQGDNMRHRGPRSLPTSVNNIHAHNPQIHLAQHTAMNHDAQDVLAVLLHLFNDKDGKRLRNVLMTMDNESREWNGAATEEKDMPPEYKSEDHEKGGAAITKDHQVKLDSKEGELEGTDDKCQVQEKPNSVQQKDGNKPCRTGPRHKLRLVDLPGPNRVFIEDIASEPDGCSSDDNVSPKTMREPRWVRLLKSGEWKPADHSKREGRVFEGWGTGGGEGEERQAPEPRFGPVVWGFGDDEEKVRKEGDRSDESDYDEEKERE